MRQPAADVGEAVLLRRHRHAVGERRHLAHDVGDRPVGLARLALLDEPGVLGEAAGVEEQRHAVAVADRAHRAQVLERDRLAAARVVGDGHEHDRDALGAALARAGASSAATSMLPLNGWQRRRVAALGDHEVDRLGAGASTLARVVSKWVLFGTTLPGPPRTVNRIFSAARPWWVGITCRNGNSSWTASRKREPRRRPGVALVAVLDRRPTGRGDIAPVPESVSRSIRTSSAWRLKRL